MMRFLHNPRALHVLFALWCALILLAAGFPLLWMAVSALRAPSDLLVVPPKLFTTPSLYWFREVFETTEAWRWFVNSSIVAFGTALMNMFLGSLAAYGLTRFKFWGREAITLGVLFVYIIPPIMIFLPLYVALDSLGLSNTYPGGILAHTVLTLPFCLWLMQSFFRGIPAELDEAALVDGATSWQIYRLIILPLAAPGVLSVGILAFIISWSEYLFSSAIMTRGEMKTVPIALGEMSNSAHAPWGEIMVLGALTALPVLLLFTVIQRWFVQGITAGAVKG
ncbi:carbohydrate ABC transporter permease [Ferrovibrio sp.]|uniref:carbohydrate ABC transporter permease n=1 Tax=Ferrovibrio sp. TaxID=1917215 RepID=UPI0025B890F5|nr:carbohydrate ABC transporter permease [Ferrovibrio sp.]MBX3456413.1 carbohydrate ABC transporter permease [Ferrovibrio sp.]